MFENVKKELELFAQECSFQIEEDFLENLNNTMKELIIANDLEELRLDNYESTNGFYVFDFFVRKGDDQRVLRMTVQPVSLVEE